MMLELASSQKKEGPGHARRRAAIGTSCYRLDGGKRPASTERERLNLTEPPGGQVEEVRRRRERDRRRVLGEDDEVLDLQEERELSDDHVLDAGDAHVVPASPKEPRVLVHVDAHESPASPRLAYVRATSK